MPGDGNNKCEQYVGAWLRCLDAWPTGSTVPVFTRKCGTGTTGMNAENHIIAEIMNLHSENEKLRAKNARLEEKVKQLQQHLEDLIRQNGEGPR